MVWRIEFGLGEVRRKALWCMIDGMLVVDAPLLKNGASSRETCFSEPEHTRDDTFPDPDTDENDKDVGIRALPLPPPSTCAPRIRGKTLRNIEYTSLILLFSSPVSNLVKLLIPRR